MSVNQSIQAFLAATEKKFGRAVREQTVIKHAGGVQVVLQRPNMKESITDLGSLRLMTRQMLSI